MKSHFTFFHNIPCGSSMMEQQETRRQKDQISGISTLDSGINVAHGTFGKNIKSSP